MRMIAFLVNSEYFLQASAFHGRSIQLTRKGFQDDIHGRNVVIQNTTVASSSTKQRSKSQVANVPVEIVQLQQALVFASSRRDTDLEWHAQSFALCWTIASYDWVPSTTYGLCDWFIVASPTQLPLPPPSPPHRVVRDDGGSGGRDCQTWRNDVHRSHSFIRQQTTNNAPSGFWTCFIQTHYAQLVWLPCGATGEDAEFLFSLCGVAVNVLPQSSSSRCWAYQRLDLENTYACCN